MITAKLKTENMDALANLQKAVRNKIIRNAIKIASPPVEQAVETKAPYRTGLLKKSIDTKIKTYRRGTIVAIIGSKTKIAKVIGYTLYGDVRLYRPSKIAHLLERGTSHSPAQPFLQPALNQTQQQFLTTMETEIAKGIENTLPKL